MNHRVEDSDQVVERREPLMEHMGAFFSALKKVIFWVFVGLGAGYFVSEFLLNWIEEPFIKVMGQSTKLIFLSPFEKIWVHLRLAFWGGLIFVLPMIYWSLYGFAKPALFRSERRRLNGMMIIVFVVFALGLYLGHRFTLPLLLEALMGFKSLSETPFLGLSAYVGTALGTLLATALLLELPVVMFHLSLWGWVPSKSWSRGRRMALVVNSVVSAILSPPDIMSMFFVMIPVQVLYECGIILARMAEWGSNEKN